MKKEFLFLQKPKKLIYKGFFNTLTVRSSRVLYNTKSKITECYANNSEIVDEFYKIRQSNMFYFSLKVKEKEFYKLSIKEQKNLILSLKIEKLMKFLRDPFNKFLDKVEYHELPKFIENSIVIFGFLMIGIPLLILEKVRKLLLIKWSTAQKELYESYIEK